MPSDPAHKTPGGGKGGLRFLRKGSVAIVIRVVSALLGYGLIIAMARWMSLEEFGRFSFAFSLATTLSVIGDFGQRRLAVRFFAAYQGEARPDRLIAVARFSARITGLSALGLSLAVAALAWVFDGHPSLYAAAALTGAMLLAEYQSFALRGLGLLTQALLPREILWRPVTLAGMALLGGGIALVTTATVALWALAGMLYALSLLQFFVIARPAWRRKLQAMVGGSDMPEPAPDLALWRPTSLRLWVATAFSQGMTYFSVVLLGLLLSPEETGPYFAALRTATLIAFPLQALNLVSSPMLARAFAAKEPARLQAVAAQTALMATGAALIGMPVLIFFGPWVLSLIDPAFAGAHGQQLIIMAGYVIASFCGSTGTLMTMTGHEARFLRFLVTWNLIGLAVMAVLTPLYAGVGAAIGLLVGKAGWNIAVVLWGRRSLGLDPSILGAVRPVAGGPRLDA